ncbi:TIM barrel protein [Candidatus Pacearchaeota archaeon]|nr:TIM barrel protein [Candidatus Pacearchaeota archaeon]
MAGDYKISNLYQGGYSSLSPKYGDVFTGYRMNPASFGTTTDPRTANVLQEVSTKLNMGVKQIEIAAIQPEVFDSIPKQHLQEINRLSKLTGVDISLHGPIVEPSGLNQQGFSESNREASERQMMNAISRAHEVSPGGNVPVTFHSSAISMGPLQTKDKEPEEAMIINVDSGSIHRIPLKERFFPGEEGKKNIQKEVEKINEEQWIENLRQLEYHSEIGKDAIDKAMTTDILAKAEQKAGKNLSDEEKAMQFAYNRGTTFLNSSYHNLKQLFDSAYKNVSPEDQEKLKTYYKEIDEKAKKIQANPKSEVSIRIMEDIIEGGIKTLNSLSAPPKVYKELNDFSREKAVETFSNVALNSYKEFKDKAPIISIENPPAGAFGFSTGEELKKIVENAQERFVENATKSKSEGGLGMSEREAERQAKKLLGVTWDVGHINMMKKYGYKNEDILKETEKIAPLLKHIHLSDNFGFEHTELPMGMGNVPMKEILEKLGQEGFDAKKIIEAGNWWQHFRTPPFKETLEAFGSPIYGMEMAPYWNQNIGGQQGYFGGYGAMLPSVNYETFGAGFSHLPTELGGQRGGGEGSRMSGKPME